MLNKNFPGFISSDGMDNPFGTKSQSLFLGGEQVETSRLFREATKVPSHSVKAMVVGSRSPEKIFEKSLQFLIGGFRGGPTRRIVDMSGHENF